MRRRLAVMAAAVTAMVAVAFVVPLCLQVRSIARDRAMSAAILEGQSIASVIAVADDTVTIEQVVTAANGASARRVSVFTPEGDVIGAPARAGDDVEDARAGRAFTTHAPGGRLALVPAVLPDGRTAVVHVFVPTSLLEQGVLRSWIVLGGLGSALVVLAVVVADFLARAIVRPTTELAGVAAELERGRLDARVVPGGPPEVEEAGHALNLLAGRIGQLLVDEREAVADLSHRLRTPITALRLEAEAIDDPVLAERVAAAVDDLTRVVDQLIAEARRPSRDGTGAVADLAAVARDRVTFWSALADEQGRRYEVEIVPEPVPVGVDADELAAAIDALLGNVFAHTPDGCSFKVVVDRNRLVVEDDGPGIPDESALARGVSGAGSTGLGLDIARRTAAAAGGRLVVGRSRRGGACLELLFPDSQSSSLP
jgi:signal transduction histidine kinase